MTFDEWIDQFVEVDVQPYQRALLAAIWEGRTSLVLDPRGRLVLVKP